MEWLNRISPCPRPLGEGEFVMSYTWHAPAPLGWTEPLRIIYDYELVLFREGDFVVEIGERRYPCSANSFIIVPPVQGHASWLAGCKPGYRYWCHFDWVYQGPHGRTPMETYQAEIRTALLRLPPAFVSKEILRGPIRNPSRTYDLAERLSAMLRYGSCHDRLTARALLLELLLELLDTSERSVSSMPRQEELAQRVRQRLEAVAFAGRRAPPLRELFEELGYCYEHLCRKFHATYGLSPLKYLHALRIGRAKRLLCDTDLSIKEVAGRTGFDDPLYFCRLFRLHVGTDPTQFRRKKR